MITINDKVIEKKYFPDGTQCLLKIDIDSKPTSIKWKYENDEECMTLWYLVNHIRNNFGSSHKIDLEMFYCPNGRMDRVKNDKEVFTLKWFCDFINSMKFDNVYVMDPHSNVTSALLNNVIVVSPMDFISKIGEHIQNDLKSDFLKIDINDIIIYFPDSGAMKRYSEKMDNKKVIYGVKDRDWATGKINGIKIFNSSDERIDNVISPVDNKPLKGKIILMIDDIISYGGTLAYSADKLKELGAKSIYAYATHTENSILDKEKGTLLKRLDNNTVNRVFTTDSLYSGKHEKITILKKQ